MYYLQDPYIQNEPVHDVSLKQLSYEVGAIISKYGGLYNALRVIEDAKKLSKPSLSSSVYLQKSSSTISVEFTRPTEELRVYFIMLYVNVLRTKSMYSWHIRKMFGFLPT